LIHINRRHRALLGVSNTSIDRSRRAVRGAAVPNTNGGDPMKGATSDEDSARAGFAWAEPLLPAHQRAANPGDGRRSAGGEPALLGL